VETSDKTIDYMTASIKTMWRRVAAIVIATIISSSQYFLLAAFVLPRTFWWVFFASQAVETSVTVYVEFGVLRGRKKKNNPSSTPNISANNLHQEIRVAS
jgi:hypothetical protein